MSLEDRMKSAADEALGSLVRQLLDHAAEERETAVRDARLAAFSEAEQAAATRVSEAEARAHADLDARVADAVASSRDTIAHETRQQLQQEFDQKLREASDAADTRMTSALADAETRAAASLEVAVAGARLKEREIEVAGVSRLLESVRGLDGATTLSEVLDALARAAAREAARAIVVVLRGDRVQGWKMSGFGARDSQPKSIDMSLGESGVIGLAVTAARAVTTQDSKAAGVGPGFETLPLDRLGVAAPVIVGGRAVAVVYADAVPFDGHERPVPTSWPDLIEVLARHAGRCLEALTTQKAASSRTPPSPGAGGHSATIVSPSGTTTASSGSALMQITDGVAEAARRTARLLVSDIRLFHEPAVTEGRRHRNLLSRLAPEIAHAREAYNNQVPPAVRTHTDYFQQELVRTLAGGDATLLGQLV